MIFAIGLTSLECFFIHLWLDLSHIRDTSTIDVSEDYMPIHIPLIPALECAKTIIPARPATIPQHRANNPTLSQSIHIAVAKQMHKALGAEPTPCQSVSCAQGRWHSPNIPEL